MTGMHHDTAPETLRRAITYNSTFGSIQSIDTTWKPATGDPVSQARYDYTYDHRGLRATARQSGSFYADYGPSTYYHYDYNARGELIATRQYLGDDVTAQTTPLPGRQYGYAYDSMGNRLSTRRTAASDSDLDEHYEANTLNQIVTKENKATPLSGTMLEGAKAHAAGPGIASTGVTRGRYWNIEMLLPNATAPVKTDLTLYFGKAAALSVGIDAYTTQQRTAFQRQQNETHTHDADGNLTADGLWEYMLRAELTSVFLPNCNPKIYRKRIKSIVQTGFIYK
jgi:hypothetical protein